MANTGRAVVFQAVCDQDLARANALKSLPGCDLYGPGAESACAGTGIERW